MLNNAISCIHFPFPIFNIFIESSTMITYFSNFSKLDKTWSWLPPIQAWKSRHGLSYGWEIAFTSDQQRYYVK